MISLGPLAGAFAGRAAKEVVNRVLEGNGSERELRKAELDLMAIDAQAAIGQKSMRPFLQLLSGVILIVYLVITALGVLINSILPESFDIAWQLMYTDGWPLLGWAITYTTGMGAVRGWEKRHDKDDNSSIGEQFGRLTRSKAPNKPTFTERTSTIQRVDQVEPLDMTRLISDLKKEEGVVYEIYRDSEDHLTFGIGHLITENDPEFGMPEGTPVSKDRVDQAFRSDLKTAIRGASSVVSDFKRLPQDARQVLISMCFQMGTRGLAKFENMLDAIDSRDWHEASLHMLDSKFAKQTPERAQRNADRLTALA